MSQITLYDRARRYVEKMPGAVSGGGGHNATFAVATVLLKGFGLPIDQARPILHEFNSRCDPPWSVRELEHKLTSCDGSADDRARGYLIGEGRTVQTGGPDAAASAARPSPPPAKREKPVFDAAMLARFAGGWSRVVDLAWLANRSDRDPALVSGGDFLKALYRPDEKVLVFDVFRSQGQAIWPDDVLPTSGPDGVWYLAAPVDGRYHPNPREGTMSRRSEESVTSWRWMVLESDAAAMRPWLGALAQLPLRIAAIYTSGGRSIHALVRMDAATKREWDACKRLPAIGEGLVILGADPGALSAVRLTRLPGCYREGKRRNDGSYERFATPALQKLLYINAKPEADPLVDVLARRNVVEDWLKLAAAGIGDADESGDDWLRAGLRYYAGVDRRCAEALANMDTNETEGAL